MRIQIVWQCYGDYIEYFHRKNPELDSQPYDSQLSRLLHDGFGWPVYLAEAFQDIGHECQIVFANVASLQRRWCVDNGVTNSGLGVDDVIALQVEAFSPDVVFLGPWFVFNEHLIQRIKRCATIVVGWLASPMTIPTTGSSIDCLWTCLPKYVERFQRSGIKSSFLQPACFDMKLAARVASDNRDIAVSFVGGLDPANFKRRISILEYVAERLPIGIWGYGVGGPWPRHPVRILRRAYWSHSMPNIRRCHQGVVFGSDMYRVLSRSLITINVHIDIADGVAANMRLFEATGCGALLFTESSAQLGQYFSEGKELVTFQDECQLVDRIEYYIAHRDELDAIAVEGSRKTRAEHSPRRRAEEIADRLAKM